MMNMINVKFMEKKILYNIEKLEKRETAYI